MLSPELIQRTPWHEFYAFFLKGNPPLIVLLLIVNTVFFILFVARRMRNKHSFQPSTAYTVQGMVILANALVIYHQDIFKFAKAASSII